MISIGLVQSILCTFSAGLLNCTPLISLLVSTHNQNSNYYRDYMASNDFSYFLFYRKNSTGCNCRILFCCFHLIFKCFNNCKLLNYSYATVWCVLIQSDYVSAYLSTKPFPRELPSLYIWRTRLTCILLNFRITDVFRMP